MRWQKLGLVLNLAQLGWPNVSKAMVPTPIQIADDRIRVYFTLCDADNIGRPHYFDVNVENPMEIIGFSNGPVMSLGKPGAFDHHGIVLAQIYKVSGDRLAMYYSGFERSVDIPYSIFTGLSISDGKGERFTRLSEDPILARSDQEVFFRCAPFVLCEEKKFRMWYVAGSDWETISGKKVPRYSLYHIVSENGIHWPNHGELCLELGEDEHGFGRPWIETDSKGHYHLFYSIRVRSKAAYRLGYAVSDDGFAWTRLDGFMGLEPTPGSFDSVAISYSSIINIGGEIYCFYNGNGFGKDGIAIAKLAEGSVAWKK